jgi:hypothetical protein
MDKSTIMISCGAVSFIMCPKRPRTQAAAALPFGQIRAIMVYVHLTRRRSSKRSDCWHVFYGDVHVGTIAARAGVPVYVDQWGWQCGFYPPSHHGQHIEDTAASFNQARADFEAAWREYLPKCTEVDFEAYRRQEAWTAWKYAMLDAGCKMPTQSTSGQARCFCGATIDIHGAQAHVYSAHMTDLQDA